jgi:hypothetical protein
MDTLFLGVARGSRKPLTTLEADKLHNRVKQILTILKKEKKKR